MALDRENPFSIISIGGDKFYYQDSKIFNMNTDAEMEIATIPRPEKAKELNNVLIQSFREPWTRIGTIDATAAHADEDALGVDERDFATNKDLNNVVWTKVPSPVSAIEVRFLMTLNGANEIIDLWAGRSNAGANIDLARVCSLDVECGSQDVVGSSTLHYADEIVITNNDWLKTISAIQSGNDTEFMARLVFDLCGYDIVLFHGRTPATEDCAIEISGFS